MRTKPDKTPTAANVQAATTPEKLAGLAAVALDPSIGAGSVASVYAELGARTNCIALAGELKAQMKALHGGDLRRGEEMLLAQAHTLDAMFNHLALRAASNLGAYVGAGETYLRLACKVQSQCRTTLEAIAAMHQHPTDAGADDGLIDEVLAVVRAVRKIRAGGDALYVTYLAVAGALGWNDMRVRRKAAVALKRGWLVNKQAGLRRPADLYVGKAPLLARVST